MTESHQNPYFNMVSIGEDGLAKIVIPAEESMHLRQDAKKVYDITTVAYVFDPKFIMGSDKLFRG